MKVIVRLTIEVDPEEWAITYGGSGRPTDVRNDIKAYVYDAVYQLQGIDESGAQVWLG